MNQGWIVAFWKLLFVKDESLVHPKMKFVLANLAKNFDFVKTLRKPQLLMCEQFNEIRNITNFFRRAKPKIRQPV